MTTPRENSEALKLLKDVRQSIWRNITPIKPPDHNLDFVSSTSVKSNVNAPNVATKLNFSSFSDSFSYSEMSMRQQETPESLKRKLITVETELHLSKAKLRDREFRISQLQPESKRFCMDQEKVKEFEDIQKENTAQKNKIIMLEKELQKAQIENSSIKTQMSDLQLCHKAETAKQDLKLSSQNQQCSALKEEIASVRSEKSEAVRKLNMEIGRLQLKTGMMSEEAEKSQAYIKSLKSKNSEMAEKVALSNAYADELKETQSRIKVLENKIAADEDAALIVASRQNDLKNLTKLEKENKVLKEEVDKHKESNVLLYQEKMWSLQEKLALSEKKVNAMFELQPENEMLKHKLGLWEALFDEKSAVNKSPTTFSRKLSEYQLNEAALTNKLLQVSSRCEALEKLKAEQGEVIRSSEQKIFNLQQNLSRQDSVIKRLHRKVTFLTKEKDNSRKLLDSYLGELTLNGTVINAAQISQLEELNAEYKKVLEKTEKENDTLREKISSYTSEAMKMNIVTSELKRIREENITFRRDIGQVEKEKSELQTKYDQLNLKNKSEPEEKIIHLRFNPLDTANRKHLEQFQKLQEENDALMKRVKVLEEEGNAAEDVTVKVKERLQSEGGESTLQDLKSQLASSKRKQEFIIENFRKKSTEYREAIYRLTGYKIDMSSEKMYKLSHMYADSRDDFLLFQLDSQSTHLVESEYSKHLSQRLMDFLRQYDSVPGFLANLTLDLFNQQTFLFNSSQ